MLGKDYIVKKAQEAVQNKLSGMDPSLQNPTSPTFIGTIASDYSTITDNATGNVYTLIYKGTPPPISLAYNLGNGQAYVKGEDFKPSFLSSSSNKGLVLAYDTTGYYLRNTGSSTKYYLPTIQDFQNVFGNGFLGQFNPNGEIQAFLSSDGNALLLGTVLQNSHILANGATSTYDSSVSLYHQFASYYTFNNITLGSYDETTQSSMQQQGYLLPVNGLLYPVIFGDELTPTNVVYCKNFLSSLIDLNSFANGNVPAPAPGNNGSQALWYPNATLHSGSAYTQFNPIFNFNWDADSGYQFIETEVGIGCLYDFSGQKTTTGNQNLVWGATPNYAIFNSFRYSLNNSYNSETKTTNYNVDLITTFVNGYLFTVTNTNWSETFYFKYDAILSGSNCDCAGEEYGYTYTYNENLNFDYSYEYDIDSVYKLFFYQTPAVWLTTATVNVTTSNPEWLKTQQVNDYLNSASQPGCATSYSDSGEPNTWDAYCFETPAISGSKIPPGNCYVGSIDNISFQASQFAYSTTQTVGCPFVDDSGNCLPLYADAGYGPGGVSTVNQYSGSVKKGNFDGSGGTWPGFYLAYYTGPAEYNYMDLNYDNLFLDTNSSYFVIYGGRSTMVINNLYNNQNQGNNSNSPAPTLFGITTQLLGDGTDTNVLESAFRGRLYDPTNTDSNTAFVYQRSWDAIYRYSSPWLIQGNLTNASAGSQSTGQALGANNSAAFEEAVTDLVDYASLMDAYGNTQAESDINNLVNQFQAGIANPSLLPAAATINNVIAEIIATDPDLTVPAQQLQSELINTASAAAGNDLTQVQPDMIGTSLPDVYTDKIFSFSGTFPFQPYAKDKNGNIVTFSRYLKAPDSYLVQEYYIDTINNLEVIQGFNIATNGLTSLGQQANGSYSVAGETLVDYILPISPTSVVT